MRNRRSEKGLTVNAVAGSYVVILGLNIADALRKGLRGFAIKRTDKIEKETYWMLGTKVFESVEPHPAPGGQYSILFHPFSLQPRLASHSGICPPLSEQAPQRGRPGRL